MSDSEDDLPLAARGPATKKATPKKMSEESDSDDDVPLVARNNRNTLTHSHTHPALSQTHRHAHTRMHTCCVFSPLSRTTATRVIHEPNNVVVDFMLSYMTQ